MGIWSTHVVNPVLYDLSYDVEKDFEPIAPITDGPLVICARKDFPANDLKELIAWLKANPDKATSSDAGVGSPQHVFSVLFQQVTGTHFQFVHYRGGGQAMQDLVTGHIDLSFSDAISALTQAQGGTIKAYAVMSKDRLTGAPQIPTVDEAGLPGFYDSVWSGIWAPKGTPAAIIEKLNAAVVDAVDDPTIRQRLTALGRVLFPRQQMTPQVLATLQRTEIEKWWPIIKAAGIRGE
jgi:tripartite-type tricarboxylate transporter receptor subunit TctC